MISVSFQILLNLFKLSHVKFGSCVTVQSIHFEHTNEQISLDFFGSVTHSTHVNIVITINNPYSAVNFNWRKLSSVKNSIKAYCLKHTDKFLSARFHFMNDSNATFSYSNFPSTETKEQMLLAHQYCHPLMIYKTGSISFH